MLKIVKCCEVCKFSIDNVKGLEDEELFCKVKIEKVKNWGKCDKFKWNAQYVEILEVKYGIEELDIEIKKIIECPECKSTQNFSVSVQNEEKIRFLCEIATCNCKFELNTKTLEVEVI